MDPLEIRPGIVIPGSDLKATFSRATGPGGQNVNKVATRVTLRFSVERSAAIAREVKIRLRQLRRLSQRGELILTCQRHREQARNFEECRNKLRELVLAALIPPRRRRPTAPSRPAVERRLTEKARQAERKRRRQVTRVEREER